MTDKLAHGRVSEIIQSYLDDSGLSFDKFQKKFNAKVNAKAPKQASIEAYVRYMTAKHYTGNKDRFIQDLFELQNTLNEAVGLYRLAKRESARLREDTMDDEKPLNERVGDFEPILKTRQMAASFDKLQYEVDGMSTDMKKYRKGTLSREKLKERINYLKRALSQYPDEFL